MSFPPIPSGRTEFINRTERKLLDGARGGHLDVVEKYIDHPDVDLGLHGDRLIGLACDGAHVEMVKLILKKCPHVDRKAAYNIAKILHDFNCNDEHSDRCKKIMECLES